MPKPNAAPSRWRNPVFLAAFVPGAGMWLAVVGWLTWLCYHPVAELIDGVDEEIAITVVWTAWSALVAVGLMAVGFVADVVTWLVPPTTDPADASNT